MPEEQLLYLTKLLNYIKLININGTDLSFQVLFLYLIAGFSSIISLFILIKRTNLLYIYSFYYRIKKLDSYRVLVPSLFAILSPILLSKFANYFSKIQNKTDEFIDLFSPIASILTALILYITLDKQQQDTKIKTVIDSLDKYEKVIDKIRFNKPSINTMNNPNQGNQTTGIEALKEIIEMNHINNNNRTYQEIREDYYIIIEQIIGSLYSTILYILELEEKSRNRYLTILKNYLSFEEQSLIFLEIFYMEKQKEYTNFDFGDLVRETGLISLYKGHWFKILMLNYFNHNLQDEKYNFVNFYQFRYKKDTELMGITSWDFWRLN